MTRCACSFIDVSISGVLHSLGLCKSIATLCMVYVFFPSCLWILITRGISITGLVTRNESWEELCLVEWLKMNDHDRVEMNRGQMFNKTAARIEGPWFKQLPYSMTWLDRTYSPICPQVLKCSRISGLVCNMTNPELTSQLWIWWSSLKLTVFITWKWMVGILVSLCSFWGVSAYFQGRTCCLFRGV